MDELEEGLRGDRVSSVSWLRVPSASLEVSGLAPVDEAAGTPQRTNRGRHGDILQRINWRCRARDRTGGRSSVESDLTFVGADREGSVADAAAGGQYAAAAPSLRRRAAAQL